MPIALIGLAQHIEHEGGILDGAGHGADMGNGAEGRERPGGDAAEGRLVAEGAGETGGAAGLAPPPRAPGPRGTIKPPPPPPAAPVATRPLRQIPPLVGGTPQTAA